MSENLFIERFKNKSSTLPTSGVIGLKNEQVLSKPPSSQIHGSVIKASANLIINKSSSPLPEHSLPTPKSYHLFKNNSNEKTHQQSANLQLNDDSPRFAKKKMTSVTPINDKFKVGGKLGYKELSRSYDKKEMKDFKPYTIKDYNNIKPKVYYQLGGLGPGNVGSDDWILKKKLNEKRTNYGLNIYYINAARIPLLPVGHGKEIELDKEDGVRQRALKFAKGIRKPPLRKVILTE